MDLSLDDESVPLLTTNLIAEFNDAKKDHKEGKKEVSNEDGTNGYDETIKKDTVMFATMNSLKGPSPTISDLKKRVLGLSQKGDWDACEITLKLLKKEAAEENITKPLDNVIDEVGVSLFWEIF